MREAIFWNAGQLFGLQFKPAAGVPVVHLDIRVWEVTDGQARRAVVLISWDDALTMFHEFGHALHGLPSVNSTASPCTTRPASRSRRSSWTRSIERRSSTRGSS